MVSKKLYPKIKYEILPDFFIRLDHNENTTKKEKQRKTLYMYISLYMFACHATFYLNIFLQNVNEN